MLNFSGGSESTTVAAATTVGVVGPVDNGESVILKPVFSFQCSAEGLYPHSSDCAKFWLCEEDGKELEPQLYICPEDYLVSFRSQVKFSLLNIKLNAMQIKIIQSRRDEK